MSSMPEYYFLMFIPKTFMFVDPRYGYSMCFNLGKGYFPINTKKVFSLVRTQIMSDRRVRYI